MAESLRFHFRCHLRGHLTISNIVFLFLVFFISQLLLPQSLRADPISLETPSGALYGTLELPQSPAPWPVALILAGFLQHRCSYLSCPTLNRE